MREALDFVDEVLGDQARAVAAFKKVVLLVAGTAMQRYGAKIEQEQEVLSFLADILIDTYASESAVLRAQDASARGMSTAAHHQDAAAVFVNEAAGRIDMAARNALASASPGVGAAEVVLYSPENDGSLATIGAAAVRRVIDLWAERTDALRRLPGVEYVLVFENRGPEVGATIAHPHGQIYAYDHVPPRQARRLQVGWKPDAEPSDRMVATTDGWQVAVPYAPVFPVAVSIAPLEQLPDLVAATDAQRDALARVLIDTFTRLDALYGQQLPLMMWLHQAPTTADTSSPPHWFEIEIVSPWRSAGVPRFIAAAEVAGEEYFNPVDPADVATRLRALTR